MRFAAGVVLLGALASCASPGTAEDFKWSVECPKSVDRGAEFSFLVRTLNAAGAEVEGQSYRFQILWPAGSGNPLRHRGVSGTAARVHARMSTGSAAMVITCENRQGLDVKVFETAFEVK